MFAIYSVDPQGVLAFVFFCGLIVFVLFETIQVIRGRVHLGGIVRAFIELLIISPVIFLLVIVNRKISEHFGLDSLESSALSRWIAVPVLSLIWTPWTHYRARQLSVQIQHRKKSKKEGVSLEK